MTQKERILITVKTYPTLSSGYVETVCTAGVRKDGKWFRLYPVPFRRLEEKEQYKKFDWIECTVTKHTSGSRPESFRLADQTELAAKDHMGKANDWAERRRLLLETCHVYEDMSVLIDKAKKNELSLAVFKPTRLLKFGWEEDEREWPPEKLQKVEAQLAKRDLFYDQTRENTFEVIKKLPYKFLYQFTDKAGNESKMRILDWEIGALYWNCFRRTQDEKKALDKVKQKYWDEFIEKDLHFFLGTIQAFHQRAPNPWTITGVFPIPHQVQTEIF